MSAENAEMITVSRLEYEELKAQTQKIEKLERQVYLLSEALRLAKHQRFGASSEKISEEAMEQLSFLFNEAEVYADTAQKEEQPAVVVAAHERRKKSNSYTLDELPENIPVKVIEHKLEGDDLVCPDCGTEMVEIGKKVVNRLAMAPIDISIEQHIYYSYKCANCAENAAQDVVVTAPYEKSIIPGSFATAEAIASIMVQKFVMGSPVYRVEQTLGRMGIKLSRQTMSNWILRAATDYLRPVYEQLHIEMRLRDVLHADETTLQVLHEPGKAARTQSYLWIYRTSQDSERPIVLSEYQPSRSSSHPKEFLAGFRGYLHTDGYAGYHNLPEEITVVGCWAHARRKFDEAMKALPKGKAKGSSAAQGLAYCSKLFELEEKWRDLSPQERYTKRQEEAKPVLDAFLAWANVRTAAPKSALGKALHYLKEQWPYLTNYLKDGRLELSNNRAERTVKPFVIDRKNFLFANTPSGAEGSAVIFSMIQTAIENDLDPYRYLVWLMKSAMNSDMTSPEAIQSLFPWNAPQECKVK